MGFLGSFKPLPVVTRLLIFTAAIVSRLFLFKATQELGGRG